jgi:hypothetical protein
VSPNAIQLCTIVQQMVKASKYAIFDRVTQKGVWRMVIMRTYSTNECKSTYITFSK